MGKIAFVFSGQGDQHPGMGKELYEKYPAARKIFDLCDKLRPGTSEQCFCGTAEELKETKNTQPCLYAMETAAASVLLDKGIVPDAAAGFSLGELSAAAVSGVFDIETGFRLVCKRGKLMQNASEKADTSMAAVVRLTNEQVQEVCGKYTEVYPVNYNYPGQVTVSGLSSQMAEFYADVKKAGGKAIPLKVKGAFHTPFMKEAADLFAEELAKTEFRKSNVPVYSDMTAKPYGDDAGKLLSGQMCSPVYWETIIRNMIDDGVDTFIEIGPGSTLTNMIRRISTDVKSVNVAGYLAEAEHAE